MVLNKEGKVLVGNRFGDTGYGLICGPGGHIEAGESALNAAIRETNEEFGIIPTDMQMVGVGKIELA